MEVLFFFCKQKPAYALRISDWSSDVCSSDLVGDIESLPFLEAIRQIRTERGPDKALFMHLTLVPWIAAAGELKTKPTQHSVKELRSIGIQPDVLICRSEQPLPESERRKIALFTNVPEKAVISDRKSVV